MDRHRIWHFPNAMENYFFFIVVEKFKCDSLLWAFPFWRPYMRPARNWCQAVRIAWKTIHNHIREGHAIRPGWIDNLSARCGEKSRRVINCAVSFLCFFFLLTSGWSGLLFGSAFIWRCWFVDVSVSILNDIVNKVRRMFLNSKYFKISSEYYASVIQWPKFDTCNFQALNKTSLILNDLL